MNRAQRIWILLGLCALAASCIFAPYAASGYSAGQTVYAPIWSGLASRSTTAYGLGAYDGGSLDVGKIGLIWAAIVIFVAAGVALSGKRQS